MKLLKSFLTLGISSFIGILINTFTTPIITRIVDPVDLGKLTIFNANVGIIASFMYLGLNESFLRFFYEYKDDKRKRGLLKVCFSIPAYLSLIVTLIAIVLYKYNFIKSENNFFIFSLLFVNVILTVWNCFAGEVLQNMQESKLYSVSLLIQKVVYCFGSVLLLLLIGKNHYSILVITTCLSVFASALFSTIASKKNWNFKDAVLPENIKEIMKYSLPMYGYFVIYSIYDTLDKLIVDNLCSEYEVGIYSAAFSLVGIFLIAQTAFVVIWRPMQTEHYTNDENDMSFIETGNRYLTILMFFMAINVIMFKDILCLFLGEKYRIGAPLIPFLIFNPIINSILPTVTSGIEISKKSYINVIIIVLSLGILIGGSYLLIPILGVEGCAIAVAVSLIVRLYLTIFFSNRFKYVNYEVGKLTLIILITLAFAFIDIHINNLAIQILTYIIALLVLTAIYRSDIKDMITICKGILKKK